MLVLMLAYPVLVHLAVVLHSPLLQWPALCCLTAVPLYPALKAGRLHAWLLLLAAVAGLGLLTRLGGGQALLYLPPVLLPALGAWFFGRTLAPGQQPLVTRIASLSRGGSLPPELLRYTRHVTWAWTLLLAGMALLSAALALLAPLAVWSLFTNFINYLFPGAMFALEYLVRRLRFRHLEHPGFVSFIRMVATTDYRRL